MGRHAKMSRKRKTMWMKRTATWREKSSVQKTGGKNARRKTATARQERPRERTKTRNGKLGFMRKRSGRSTRTKTSPTKRNMLKVTMKPGKATRSARRKRRGKLGILRRQRTKTPKNARRQLLHLRSPWFLRPLPNGESDERYTCCCSGGVV